MQEKAPEDMNVQEQTFCYSSFRHRGNATVSYFERYHETHCSGCPCGPNRTYDLGSQISQGPIWYMVFTQEIAHAEKVVIEKKKKYM